jgi:3D (Asp-Asp-Asp) domain-containing protein
MVQNAMCNWARSARPAWWLKPIAWCVTACAVAASAIVVKEHGSTPPMVRIDAPAAPALATLAPPLVVESFEEPDLEREPSPVLDVAQADSAEIRWFDGRPVRPARTIWMTVTAYSPDARSCGPFADGKTATLHSVWTNAMQLVAADPRVLPYGSMLTIPGYAEGEIVPVLDCGSAIKGSRLDVLYPSHTRARKWGVQRLAVTVWEYADGKPATNPRHAR